MLKLSIESRIPSIKSGIPPSKLGLTEAWNPFGFAACILIINVVTEVVDKFPIHMSVSGWAGLWRPRQSGSGAVR